MKKGFTLIELLAVIIVLGIVSVIAIPIIGDVVKDSKKSAGLAEAKLIYKEINKYCDTEEVHEGINGYDKICTDGENIKNNIDKIVNLDDCQILDISYNDNKIDTFKIMIENNIYSLVNDKIIFGNYDSLIKKVFNNYTKDNLTGLIKDDLNENKYYYKGNNVEVFNNYLIYGDYLWRILSIDIKENTLKLITEKSIIKLAATDTGKSWQGNKDICIENYKKSLVNLYLNGMEDEGGKDSKFYYNLDSNVKNNIRMSEYDIGKFDNSNIVKINRKVGLLDENNYNKHGGKECFLNNNETWWLGNYWSSTNVRLVKSNGEFHGFNAGYPVGIRPVITINNIYVNNGDGTLNNSFSMK